LSNLNGVVMRSGLGFEPKLSNPDARRRREILAGFAAAAVTVPVGSAGSAALQAASSA
jgi:hypothetical protein